MLKKIINYYHNRLKTKLKEKSEIKELKRLQKKKLLEQRKRILEEDLEKYFYYGNGESSNGLKEASSKERRLLKESLKLIPLVNETIRKNWYVSKVCDEWERILSDGYTNRRIAIEKKMSKYQWKATKLGADIYEMRILAESNKASNCNPFSIFYPTQSDVSSAMLRGGKYEEKIRKKEERLLKSAEEEYTESVRDWEKLNNDFFFDKGAIYSFCVSEIDLPGFDPVHEKNPSEKAIKGKEKIRGAIRLANIRKDKDAVNRYYRGAIRLLFDRGWTVDSLYLFEDLEKRKVSSLEDHINMAEMYKEKWPYGMGIIYEKAFEKALEQVKQKDKKISENYDLPIDLFMKITTADIALYGKYEKFFIKQFPFVINKLIPRIVEKSIEKQDTSSYLINLKDLEKKIKEIASEYNRFDFRSKGIEMRAKIYEVAATELMKYLPTPPEYKKILDIHSNMPLHEVSQNIFIILSKAKQFYEKPAEICNKEYSRAVGNGDHGIYNEIEGTRNFYNRMREEWLSELKRLKIDYITIKDTITKKSTKKK